MMIMPAILFEHLSEGAFPKQDEPQEDFFLHGPHPSLGVGIQIRTAWGKLDGCDAYCFDGFLKSRAELSSAAVEHLLTGSQEASLRHGCIAGHLSHPFPVGVWCQSRHVHLPQAASLMDDRGDR